MQPVDPRIDPQLVPAGSRAVVVAEHQDEYLDLPSVVTPQRIRATIDAHTCDHCREWDGRTVTPEQVLEHLSKCTGDTGCRCRLTSAVVITRWQPSPEERAAIARGEDIYLTIWGTPIRPVMLSVGACDWRNA